jgi:hypothetical protein
MTASWRGAWLSRAASSVLVLALGRHAGAAPTEVESALATALFNEARSLTSEGRWAEACVKFAESQRLDPGGGTLLNLALCHEMEGKLATAWTEFNEALAIAERQGRDDRASFASLHIEQIAPKLPHIVVVVNEPAPDQELTLDGAVFRQPAWGTRVPVDPGNHVLRARAPGRVDFQVTLDARAERTLTVQVPRLEPDATPPPEAHEADAAPAPKPRAERRSSPAGPRPRTSSLRTWAYLSFGVGAAGIGTGAIAGIAALRKQSRLDEACAGPDRCPDAQSANIDAMNRYAEISTVAFAVGATAAVAGIVLLLVEGDEPSVPREDQASSGRVPVRLFIGARGAAVTASF